MHLRKVPSPVLEPATCERVRKGEGCSGGVGGVRGTRPAMSTNSSCGAVIRSDSAMAANLSRRSSGTATLATLGSIVQNA